MNGSSDRREFLKRSAAIVGGGTLTSAFLGCQTATDKLPTDGIAVAEEAWTGFKFAMCNECMMDLSWAEQCRIISEAGYTAVEIAPFTLVKEGVTEITQEGRAELNRVMSDHGLDCVGMHWLLSPPPHGMHFTTPNAEQRQKTVDYLRALVDFSADLNGPYMIFGSPGQRSTDGISVEEAVRHFGDGLAAVADHAQERDVKILIEPLTKEQTNVINTMAEAVAVVDRVNHPAIRSMFDYHNTADETDPMDTLIRDYIDYIDHVQIQEMDGRHLGTGPSLTDFPSTFQAFKDVGYNGWISLEIFDFEPGGETIAKESMAVLQKLAESVS